MNTRDAGPAGAGREIHNYFAMGRPNWITLRPLKLPRDGSGRPAPGFLGTVDFEAIYRDGAAAKRWRRARDLLERLALVAEAAAGLPSPPGRTGKSTDEELADRIVRAASRLDPDELGLPPVAVLAPESTSPDEAPAITDPRLAVCLLTRLSGRLFIARRTPHAPPRERFRETLTFLAMEAPDARAATR